MSCPLGGPVSPADSCPGISCHPFFFLAGDLPGGSLAPGHGKAQISGVMNVLNTQE